MFFDAPPPLILPTPPAVIRPAEPRLLNPGFFPATRIERRAALSDLIRSGKISKAEALNALVVKIPPALAFLVVNQLVGFGAGPAPVTALTFVDSATSDQAAITVPSAAQSNDIGVLLDFASASTPVPTDVIPTDWTGVPQADPNDWFQDAGSNDDRIRVSYRLFFDSPAGSSVTGMNSTRNSKVLFIFRPDGFVESITPSTWLSSCIPTNPASQAVSAAGQRTPLIVLGMVGTRSGTAAFSTASPAFTATAAVNEMIAGYTVYNSSPSDHTVDMNDLGNANALASGFIRVQ